MSNLSGLDRLMNDGLSVDEVAAVRAAFRPQLAAHASTVPRLPDEDPYRYLARVEDSWMATQDTTSEFGFNIRNRSSNLLHNNSNSGNNLNSGVDGFFLSANTNSVNDLLREDPDGVAVGTYMDFIWGFAMGSLIGVMMMFCIWDRNVPYRQKLGILAGVLTNFFLGVLHQNP
eukprot:gene2362-2834_t